MVLGDETTRVAPAHRILRSQQGTGWIQDEDGTFDKVRADYWPDKTIREVARRYPSPVYVELPSDQQTAEDGLPPATSPVVDATQEFSEPRARKPRTPRKPRRPRNREDQGNPLDRLGDRDGSLGGRGDEGNEQEGPQAA